MQSSADRCRVTAPLTADPRFTNRNRQPYFDFSSPKTNAVRASGSTTPWPVIAGPVGLPRIVHGQTSTRPVARTRFTLPAFFAL